MLRFDDYAQAARQVTTTDGLAKLYARAVAQEGYENCILTSVRGRKLGHIAWFEFPSGYVDAYVQNRWDLIDPVLACALRAARPFAWSDVAATTLSQEQINFMEGCRELKVQQGLMFPLHGPNQRLDVMSISRRVDEKADPALLGTLHAISVQTWHRYQELTGDELFEAPDIALTDRELEVLRWCKDGKSRPEIAEILSVSKRTVEFHLESIMNKLGAHNQITAVVMALQKNIITL